MAKLAARERAGKSASDGSGELLSRQKSAFQAIRKVGPDPHLVLNTTLPVKKWVDRTIRKLPVKPARNPCQPLPRGLGAADPSSDSGIWE